LKISAPEHFDLDHTLGCGQVFRWRKIGEWWYGVVEDNVIKIMKENGELHFDSHPEKIDSHLIKRYFRFDDDLQEVISQISKDQLVKDAVKKGQGLRIVRQEPWECLISYICATNANIPRIKIMIENMSRKFGVKIRYDKEEFYTFPKVEELTRTTINKLRCCKLGYRAKYVLETAKSVYHGKIDLNKLQKLNYKTSKKKLLKKVKGKKLLPGVGLKVADCILLFSMEKTEAFPIDVWIMKAITDFYHNLFNSSFIAKLKKETGKTVITVTDYNTICNTMQKYFGKYAGYAQEYLFHYIRSKCQINYQR
jgi:N-glycosylase/DNA lyase